MRWFVVTAALWVVASFAPSPAAAALLYRFTGTATGTLAGTPFTGATFRLDLLADSPVITVDTTIDDPEEPGRANSFYQTTTAIATATLGGSLYPTVDVFELRYDYSADNQFAYVQTSLNARLRDGEALFLFGICDGFSGLPCSFVPTLTGGVDPLAEIPSARVIGSLTLQTGAGPLVITATSELAYLATPLPATLPLLAGALGALAIGLKNRRPG